MTKREFLDTVFALAPNEANKIMDAFDEYVDSNEPHWIPVTERLPEEPFGCLGTDCISRQAAIKATWQDTGYTDPFNVVTAIRDRIQQLPPAQPEIIRCRNCKFASGDSRICMKFGHSPIGELDFCSFAERRENE